MEQPELVGRRCVATSREARANRLARYGRRDCAAAATIGDHTGRATCARELGCRDLRAHATAAPGRAVSGRIDGGQRGLIGHLTDERGIRMLRIARVETLLVGQQHQQARTEQHGNLRCQGVVVAKGDLLRGRRVVLVDDRGDAPGEQRFERMSRIEVRLAAFEVTCCQQHLSRCTVGTPE